VIRDAQGDSVVSASSATWDRNLWQVLFDRPRYGTLFLHQPRFDVERRADGTFDLYEALSPILTRNPKVDLHIKAVGGQLRFRDASQATPVTAKRVELTLDLPASPRPLTWSLRLENPESTGPAMLTVDGRYDRWHLRSDGTSDLALDVQGKDWRWSFGDADIALSGIFDGRLAIQRQNSRWQVESQAELKSLEGLGTRLAGDHPRFGNLNGNLKASETDQGWIIQRLDVHSSLVNLQAKTTPTAGIRLEGGIDLAELTHELPHLLHMREGVRLERGDATFIAEAKSEAKNWDLEAKISDIHARDHDRAFTLPQPITVAAKLSPHGKRWGIEDLAVRTKSLELQGSGDLDRGLEISGTIDLKGFLDQFHDLLAFNLVDLNGKGNFHGKYQRLGRAFQSTLDVDLDSFGLAGDSAFGFQREQTQIQLALRGASSPLGLPESWSDFRVGISSGELSSEWLADSRGLKAKARFPVSGRQFGEGKLDAHWDGDILAIDRVDIGLSPNDERSLSLVAQGKFDLAKRELILTPSGDPNVRRVLALGEDGLRVTGIGRPGSTRAAVTLVGDVASAGRLLADSSSLPISGWRGDWSAQVSLESLPNNARLASQVNLDNLARVVEGKVKQRIEGPVTLALNADYVGDSDRLEISELGLKSPYGVLQGAGRLVDLQGQQNVDLQGTLLPDWEAISTLASERIEPGARASGKVSHWKVQGSLNEAGKKDPVRSLVAELGINLQELDIYGLHAGPALLALRATQGRLTVAPIDTPLNGGRVHLEPQLEFDETDGPALRLDPTSSIVDAEINEEVSRRFLSYVAPVLDRATRARGRVSVNLQDAYLPINTASKRATSVEGAVVFQNVEFTPGPFVDALLDIVGREERPTVKLDEPVSLTIADHRVYQHGFAFPLGRLTEIELEGWVDFDRNLEMKASVPLTPAMVGNRPLLENIVGGTRIQVPIRGTLQKPEVDREAMNLALKDLGKTLLQRGAVQGAAALFMRLTQGRDPNAPPPPTAAERRAQRKERLEERRRARQRQRP